MGIGGFFKKRLHKDDLGLDLDDPLSQNNTFDNRLPPGPNLDSGFDQQNMPQQFSSTQNQDEEFARRFTPPTLEEEEANESNFGPSSMRGSSVISQTPQQGNLQRDFEFLSLKLDNISAQLKNLDHRLAKIEKIAEESNKEEPRKKGWEY